MTVALQFPNAIICLISTMAYHGLTAQIPHEVSFAGSRNSRVPTLNFPPVCAHKFTEAIFKTRVKEPQIDEVSARIYSPEKTLADCRNKLGLNVVLKVLKRYKYSKKFNLEAVLEFAKICRVEKVMKPYMEAML